jgi:hypothetical protein
MGPAPEKLMCIMHTNNGKPIKTKLAQQYPLLTRRERRAAHRMAMKHATKS